MIISIETVWFKRTRDGKKEMGIMLNGDNTIIDENCEVVDTPIWNYSVIPGISLLDLKIGGNYPKKGEGS